MDERIYLSYLTLLPTLFLFHCVENNKQWNDNTSICRIDLTNITSLSCLRISKHNRVSFVTAYLQVRSRVKKNQTKCFYLNYVFIYVLNLRRIFPFLSHRSKMTKGKILGNKLWISIFQWNKETIALIAKKNQYLLLIRLLSSINFTTTTQCLQRDAKDFSFPREGIFDDISSPSPGDIQLLSK